jgi:hypothetical protein
VEETEGGWGGGLAALELCYVECKLNHILLLFITLKVYNPTKADGDL